jgi:hypothetical protein
MSVTSHYHGSKQARKEFFETPGVCCWNCGACKNPAAEHIYLSGIQVSRYREEGYIVNICHTMRHAASLYFCLVNHPPPEDPCDVEHMLEISS